MLDPITANPARPWPAPARPWVQRQTWYDLLFAHWPLPPAQLADRIPPGLTLDTFDGQAWLAVVPFRMSGIRFRHQPAWPYLSAFPELNVRTYVTDGRKAGVWFLSLDAARLAAVWFARLRFNLPYFHAAMRCQPQGDAIDYQSERRRGRAPAASLRATYGPTSPVFRAAPGSLVHWLTERYCLYAADRRGRLFRGEIAHAPWPLQEAQATFSRNTMDAAQRLVLPATAPVLHFARRLDVVVWNVEPL